MLTSLLLKKVEFYNIGILLDDGHQIRARFPSAIFYPAKNRSHVGTRSHTKK